MLPDTQRDPLTAAPVGAALVDLVASHLARHKHLTRGVTFDALVGDGEASINQSGLRKPITFTFKKEA